MGSSTSAERRPLASRRRSCCLRPLRQSRPLQIGFRGSIAHPSRLLCTLRGRRHRRARATLATRQDATPLPAPDFHRLDRASLPGAPQFPQFPLVIRQSQRWLRLLQFPQFSHPGPVARGRRTGNNQAPKPGVRPFEPPVLATSPRNGHNGNERKERAQATMATLPALLVRGLSAVLALAKGAWRRRSTQTSKRRAPQRALARRGTLRRSTCRPLRACTKFKRAAALGSPAATATRLILRRLNRPKSLRRATGSFSRRRADFRAPQRLFRHVALRRT